MNVITRTEFTLLHVVEMPRPLELVRNKTDCRFLMANSTH